VVNIWPAIALKLTFICTWIARFDIGYLFKILIILMLVSCAVHQPAKVRDESYGAGSIPKYYKVIPGDTLFSIAWRFGLKYKELAKYNNISPPYIIKPSQLIRLDYMASTTPLVAHSTRRVQNPTDIKSSRAPTQIDNKNKTQNIGSITSKTGNSDAPVWGWPSGGRVLFGFQSNNGLNKGIDIVGKLGEPVLAAASGQVVYAGSGLRGYGNLLIVKHSDVFLSAYAHNNRLLVREGDTVTAGQHIADMGSSGTDRVKLHFEIRREGTPVDPMVYLPKKK